MQDPARWFLAILLCAGLAGCTLTVPEAADPGGGDTVNLGGGTGTVTPDDGADTPDGQPEADAAGTDDALSAEFPGCAPAAEGEAWRAEVLQLVNDERAAWGLDPLSHSQTLEDQAEQYACEMIYYGFFAHDNPVTGSELPDRAAEFGYDYWVIGENLAAGQPTPVRVVQDWMGSPGHRANILDERFTEAGVGVRVGGEYGIYWVLEFGLPR